MQLNELSFIPNLPATAPADGERAGRDEFGREFAHELDRAIDRHGADRAGEVRSGSDDDRPTRHPPADERAANTEREHDGREHEGRGSDDRVKAASTDPTLPVSDPATGDTASETPAEPARLEREPGSTPVVATDATPSATPESAAGNAVPLTAPIAAFQPVAQTAATPTVPSLSPSAQADVPAVTPIAGPTAAIPTTPDLGPSGPVLLQAEAAVAPSASVASAVPSSQAIAPVAAIAPSAPATAAADPTLPAQPVSANETRALIAPEAAIAGVPTDATLAAPASSSVPNAAVAPPTAGPTPTPVGAVAADPAVSLTTNNLAAPAPQPVAVASDDAAAPDSAQPAPTAPTSASTGPALKPPAASSAANSANGAAVVHDSSASGALVIPPTQAAAPAISTQNVLAAQTMAAGKSDYAALTPGQSVTPAAAPAGATPGTPTFVHEVQAAAAAHRAAVVNNPATQLAVHVFRAAVDGLDHINVRLSPAELGRVEVDLDFTGDGRVVVAVSADRPETLDLLQRDAKTLEKALQEAGLHADPDSLAFKLRDQNADQFDDNRRFERGDEPGSRGRDDEPVRRADPILIGSTRALDISV